MKCVCGKNTPVLYEGRLCKGCFDRIPKKELEPPKKKQKTNRKGRFIVRIREGVYYNSKRKDQRVSREDARVFIFSARAVMAAKRLKGKVEKV